MRFLVLAAVLLSAALLSACAPDPAYQHLQAACGEGVLDACATAASLKLDARTQTGVLGAHMMGY